MTAERTAERLPSVGFIGLGDQGLPMAAAIWEAGYPLQAWARRPASLKALAGVPHARHDKHPGPGRRERHRGPVREHDEDASYVQVAVYRGCS